MAIPSTHTTHPATALYSSAGALSDGFSAAFAGGWSDDPRDGLFPVFADSGRAGEARTAGWELVAGLWVPPRAAPSWRAMTRREPLLDLSGWESGPVRWREAGCDWKIFMEIYFDDYHVEPFHPGLSSSADCRSLEWLWEGQAQAQVVAPSAMSGSGSAAYAELARRSREAFGDPGRAAVWAALYPSTMVEWLAGGVALSVAAPAGPGRCLNGTSFAYPKGVAEAFPEFVAAHQAAYWETAAEDDLIARAMQRGRDVLAARGEDDRGPAHPHLEAGVVAFHAWLARRGWEDGAAPAPKGKGASPG